jgi:hypothetical protein
MNAPRNLLGSWRKSASMESSWNSRDTTNYSLIISKIAEAF